MAWVKDAVSQAPKVIYTPDENGPVGCTKLVYDPYASADQRITIYLSHLSLVGETLSELEAALGL